MGVDDALSITAIAGHFKPNPGKGAQIPPFRSQPVLRRSEKPYMIQASLLQKVKIFDLCN